MKDTSKYYAVLGLKEGSSLREVKLAYRQLVKTWHPDRFQDNIQFKKLAQEKTKQIIEAYKTLNELNNSDSNSIKPVNKNCNYSEKQKQTYTTTYRYKNYNYSKNFFKLDPLSVLRFYYKFIKNLLVALVSLMFFLITLGKFLGVYFHSSSLIVSFLFTVYIILLIKHNSDKKKKEYEKVYF